MQPTVITMNNSTTNPNSTWLIVVASRGIGLELTAQLLKRGDRVFATARNIEASGLKPLQESTSGFNILEYDVSSELGVE